MLAAHVGRLLAQLVGDLGAGALRGGEDHVADGGLAADVSGAVLVGHRVRAVGGAHDGDRAVSHLAAHVARLLAQLIGDLETERALVGGQRLVAIGRLAADIPYDAVLVVEDVRRRALGGRHRSRAIGGLAAHVTALAVRVGQHELRLALAARHGLRPVRCLATDFARWTTCELSVAVQAVAARLQWLQLRQLHAGLQARLVGVGLPCSGVLAGGWAAHLVAEAAVIFCGAHGGVRGELRSQRALVGGQIIGGLVGTGRRRQGERSRQRHD